MDNIQQGIIALIRAALTNEPQPIPDDFDLEKGAQIGKRHGILPMLYYGLVCCGVDKSLPLMSKLFRITCQNILVSERQMLEINGIFSAFDEHKIAYMPLKGTLIKELYPKPDMRAMGDADILIKLDQYDAIKPIMISLGFEEKLESDHELIWEKSPVCIELHKRLIPSYTKDYCAYFGDGWNLAKCCTGTRYSMTDEDQLIYLFVHFAKHYRDAGIGIRHFVDLWVYQSQKPSLDTEYLKQELSKLSLYDFYVNVMNTLAVWFDNQPATDISDFITAIIFNSGIYGSKEATLLSQAVKRSKTTGSAKNVKLSKFLDALFPSYVHMCDKYPLLKKCAILLPFAWIYRIITSVLFRRDNIKSQQQRIRTINAEKITDYQHALNYVGLDFNFEE